MNLAFPLSRAILIVLMNMRPFIQFWLGWAQKFWFRRRQLIAEDLVDVVVGAKLIDCFLTILKIHYSICGNRFQ